MREISRVAVRFIQWECCCVDMSRFQAVLISAQWLLNPIKTGGYYENRFKRFGAIGWHAFTFQ